MKRGARVAVVTIAAASSMAVVVALTAFNAATQGPIGTLLDRLGAGWGSLEYAVRERLTGDSRGRSLAWLTPYRNDVMRLRTPDVVLLGAYDSKLPASLEGVVELEQAIGAAFPLVQLYTAWGDKPDQRFPLQLATAISDMGSIPVITWEPWLTDFENASHPGLPLRAARDRHGLAAVARGDYDFYVDAWALDARRFGRPLFVRFAHEMNDPYRYPWGPQNNSKEEFIAAWRHVVARFAAAGATNVLWVWSPHVAYQYWETYYPGTEAVAWVATGALNFGTVAHWSRWWTFRELFGSKYKALMMFNKPIMIAEFGSLAVGGDRTRWYLDAIDALSHEYTGVKAVLFFNGRNDQTVTYQKVDWSLTGDPAAAAAVRHALTTWGAAARNLDPHTVR
jgi:Glycosyl hydrolase family 26